MVFFDVNFTDPKGFYYPGETVMGQITVNLPKEIEFRTLTLKFRGKSHCYWSEGTGDDRKSYSNTENYFSEKTVLLNTLPPADGIQLGPGQFTYPFSFGLPLHIPASFEAPVGTGWVRYYIKIKFDTEKLLKSDIKQEIGFKVVPPPTNLNQTPRLLEPASNSVEKFLCCLCCQSGPIQLKCQINKQAFNPGEAIFLNVEVDNTATDTDLRQVKIKLEETVVFISLSHSQTRHHRNISSCVVGSGIKGRDQGSWQNVQVNIPTDIAPSFENCKCVHLTYNCVVSVDIPSAIDSKVEFPISIVYSVQATQPPLGTQFFNPYVAYPPGPSAPPVTMQPELLPSQPPPPYMGYTKA